MLEITANKEVGTKINLHVTEACNYSCKHCFAKFNSTKVLSLDYWKQIVNNCIDNSDVKEFNIAGGEPLLYKNLLPLVKYIRERGKRCSLITNGSLINEDWLRDNTHLFCMIGFSIDSFDSQTKSLLGRETAMKKQLSLENFKTYSNTIKQINPNCVIKVNTVVSSLNYEEDIFNVLKDLKVDKWKILKMHPFETNKFSNKGIEITNKKFEFFCNNNIENLVSYNKENNSTKFKVNNLNVIIEYSVKNANIMVDSNGDLVNNAINCSYFTVGNCLKSNFKSLLLNLKLDEDLYNSRY